ncbi:Protein of unknown function [Gryllus bimaculatus]|nr:Protein of unknown function [Gryllus bimaculatus]
MTVEKRPAFKLVNLLLTSDRCCLSTHWRNNTISIADFCTGITNKMRLHHSYPSLVLDAGNSNSTVLLGVGYALLVLPCRRHAKGLLGPGAALGGRQGAGNNDYIGAHSRAGRVEPWGGRHNCKSIGACGISKLKGAGDARPPVRAASTKRGHLETERLGTVRDNGWEIGTSHSRTARPDLNGDGVEQRGSEQGGTVRGGLIGEELKGQELSRGGASQSLRQIAQRNSITRIPSFKVPIPLPQILFPLHPLAPQRFTDVKSDAYPIATSSPRGCWRPHPSWACVPQAWVSRLALGALRREQRYFSYMSAVARQLFPPTYLRRHRVKRKYAYFVAGADAGALLWRPPKLKLPRAATRRSRRGGRGAEEKGRGGAGRGGEEGKRGGGSGVKAGPSALHLPLEKRMVWVQMDRQQGMTKKISSSRSEGNMIGGSTRFPLLSVVLGLAVGTVVALVLERCATSPWSSTAAWREESVCGVCAVIPWCALVEAMGLV